MFDIHFYHRQKLRIFCYTWKFQVSLNCMAVETIKLGVNIPKITFSENSNKFPTHCYLSRKARVFASGILRVSTSLQITTQRVSMNSRKAAIVTRTTHEWTKARNLTCTTCICCSFIIKIMCYLICYSIYLSASLRKPTNCSLT